MGAAARMGVALALSATGHFSGRVERFGLPGQSSGHTAETSGNRLVMKIAVHLVTWNGSKYIPDLFYSLKEQTNRDWKFHILDNGSTDNTVDCIKAAAIKFGIQYELIENKENAGFARGHNVLFRAATADYLLLINQDTYLEPYVIERLARAAAAEPWTAAVAPILFHWDFPKGFSRRLDAFGLQVFRSRRVVEWLAGKTWSKTLVRELSSRPNFKLTELSDTEGIEVFGLSGTLALFRVSALNQIAFGDNKIFDESYGSYKEDVDLAWRLRVAGYKSFVVIDTFAFHDRTAAPGEDMTDGSAVENKKAQPRLLRYNSYKNHLMTLYKNEYGQNWLLDWPWILWYEAKKFIWFLLFDRDVLKGWGEIWRMRHELRAKRNEIRERRRVGWREMRRWIV